MLYGLLHSPCRNWNRLWSVLKPASSWPFFFLALFPFLSSCALCFSISDGMPEHKKNTSHPWGRRCLCMCVCVRVCINFWAKQCAGKFLKQTRAIQVGDSISQLTPAPAQSSVPPQICNTASNQAFILNKTPFHVLAFFLCFFYVWEIGAVVLLIVTSIFLLDLARVRRLSPNPQLLSLSLPLAWNSLQSHFTLRMLSSCSAFHLVSCSFRFIYRLSCALISRSFSLHPHSAFSLFLPVSLVCIGVAF